MKSHHLDSPYLGKRSLINAVLLLNKYKLNEEIHFRTQFESKLATYLNAKHVFACNSGTLGLYVALLSLGVKKGDEIITNSLNDNMGTFSPILKCGAKPILAKPTDNGIMDVADLEKKITSRTKGVIPVHLNGFTEDLVNLQHIKEKYGLFILEDACQALGSKMKVGDEWKNAGTIGDIGVFSFGLLKLITTIEGGILVTHNRKLASRIDTLLGSGIYTNKNFLPGFNSRMDHLRAAIGLGNLEEIEFLISERKRKWLNYYHSLRGYEWLTVKKPNKNQIINYMSFNVCVTNEKIRKKLIGLLPSAGYDLAHDIKREKINKFVSLNADFEMKNYIQQIKERNILLPTHHEISESDMNEIIKCFKHVNLEINR